MVTEDRPEPLEPEVELVDPELELVDPEPVAPAELSDVVVPDAVLPALEAVRAGSCPVTNWVKITPHRARNSATAIIAPRDRMRRTR